MTEAQGWALIVLLVAALLGVPSGYVLVLRAELRRIDNTIADLDRRLNLEVRLLEGRTNNSMAAIMERRIGAALERCADRAAGPS